MAKVKNKRENHTTKRGTYGYGYTQKKQNEVSSQTGQKKPTARRVASGSGRKAPTGSNKTEAFCFAENAERSESLIIGRNPVTEALKSGREIDKLLVSSTEGSMIKILAMAKEKGIPIMKVDKAALDRIAPGQAHQGVAAYSSPYEYAEMEDIFARAEARGEEPFIIILDNMEDPHNLGAIMRTAECAGAHGIIIPRRRACGLTETVAKASAGAIEYMPCVKVTNIASTIDELKKKGIWVAACDMGGTEYYKTDLTGKLAVVIGSEGFGISKLVREKCDFVVSMPMVGEITSLNASNAAAIIMYEVRKQRDGK